MKLLIHTFVIATAAGLCQAADRDVQIRTVNFETGVVELHNFSDAESVDMSGWRFCTQSISIILIYTSGLGLNGQVLAPGESLFVHLNNDADEPGEINLSSLGNFATPFAPSAYSIGIYFPNAFGFVNFSDGNLMADFLQWSIDGIDNLTADERSDEAEAGGVWTDQTLWIATAADSTEIRLKPESGGAVLHGPDDYDVLGPFACPADINGDGVLDAFDVFEFLGDYDLGACTGPSGDYNGDGSCDAFDVFEFLGDYDLGNGCP